MKDATGGGSSELSAALATICLAASLSVRRNSCTYMIHAHQGYEHSARERVREATAVYFEWLAQKDTRDYDRRQRLVEVAGFYRSPLAGIIPAMPTQYKIKVEPSLTRAKRWHARAEECRTLAARFTDPTCRERLTRLAQTYNCMAAAAE